MLKQIITCFNPKSNAMFIGYMVKFGIMKEGYKIFKRGLKLFFIYLLTGSMKFMWC